MDVLPTIRNNIGFNWFPYNLSECSTENTLFFLNENLMYTESVHYIIWDNEKKDTCTERESYQTNQNSYSNNKICLHCSQNLEFSFYIISNVVQTAESYNCHYLLSHLWNEINFPYLACSLSKLVVPTGHHCINLYFRLSFMSAFLEKYKWQFFHPYYF